MGLLVLSDLGEFALGMPAGDANFNYHNFTLNILFSKPLVGAAVPIFAELSGKTKKTSNGKVDVQFESIAPVAFSIGGITGTFMIAVDDIVGLGKGQKAILTGKAEDPRFDPAPLVAMPEPGPAILFVCGLLVFGWRRRRTYP